MKIAFVNPPFLAKFSRGQRSPGVTKGGTLYYPYWLAYAAGWAQKEGFEVGLFDFVAQKKDPAQAIKSLKDFDPQLVVLETSTPSIENDVAFTVKVKKILPQAFTVLVGTHPSAFPRKTLEMTPEIDAVALGEYDFTVSDLAKALTKREDLKKVAGLCLRVGKKLITTPPRPKITNLDDFPFVSQIYKDFLNLKDYYFAAARYPMVMIITGRGCPFSCSFCVYPQTMHGHLFRFRTPENVVAEFAWMRRNLPEVQEVVIEDDTFTANLPRVRKICQLLIRAKNTLSWSVNTRVNLDLPTMKLMKRAGCRLLIVGYESGSQEILNNMGKKIKLADSLKFAENARRANLLVHGCFMVGNPGETKETAKRTLEFAKKLDPDSAQFYPLFVYPGTILYNWAKKNGYLKTEKYSRWLDKDGRHACVINLSRFSAEEIMAFCEKAFLSFHFRPKYLLKKTVQLFQSPAEGWRSLKSLGNFLRSKLL